VLVRSAGRDDSATWAALRSRLWPSAAPEELAADARDFLEGKRIPTIAAVFIAEEDAAPLGFLELALRSFSDGCESMPVPHVEGWYVGFSELASDTEPWNEASLAAHARCGFHETERLVKFCKRL
jgi:aminoglycoside 6'-N-acetyltransferase I